jgi:hypothetical protein
MRLQAPKKPPAVKHTRQGLEKSCQTTLHMLKSWVAYKAVKTVGQVVQHSSDWSFEVLPALHQTPLFCFVWK